jgi:hypothetical protein
MLPFPPVGYPDMTPAERDRARPRPGDERDPSEGPAVGWVRVRGGWLAVALDIATLTGAIGVLVGADVGYRSSGRADLLPLGAFVLAGMTAVAGTLALASPRSARFARCLALGLLVLAAWLLLSSLDPLRGAERCESRGLGGWCGWNEWEAERTYVDAHVVGALVALGTVPFPAFGVWLGERRRGAGWVVSAVLSIGLPVCAVVLTFSALALVWAVPILVGDSLALQPRSSAALMWVLVAVPCAGGAWLGWRGLTTITTRSGDRTTTVPRWN